MEIHKIHVPVTTTQKTTFESRNSLWHLPDEPNHFPDGRPYTFPIEHLHSLGLSQAQHLENRAREKKRATVSAKEKAVTRLFIYLSIYLSLIYRYLCIYIYRYMLMHMFPIRSCASPWSWSWYDIVMYFMDLHYFQR